MLIALDAGHGGSDPGAVYNGRREKDDNLKLAMAVGDILKNEGMDVFYTRDNDIYETPFKKATDANNSGADYFVSFHRNSGENPNAASGVQVLDANFAPIKIQLGKKLTEGLGAGSDPTIGEKSALESLDELETLLEGYRLVFITCGMGGGTGLGAAHVIAKTCMDKGILTVAIVTKPFGYEGYPREVIATEGIEKLRENVDILITIPNDRLLEAYSDMSFEDAFAKADEVLHYAVMGITNIIINRGTINLDFNDLCTVIRGKGLAHLGIGSSKGNDAVMDALNKALSSPLLETTIEGASYVLFNVEGKAGIKEMNEAARCIQSIAGRDVHILWGTVGDVDGDRDEVTVTLIATGIRECEKKIVEPDFVSIEKNRYKSPIEEMSIKVPAFLQKKIKNNL